MEDLEKLLMSWEEFGNLSKDFAARLKEKYNSGVDLVIGIAKGGLPLSVYLANSLGTKWDSIRIQSYMGDAVRGEMRLVHDLHTDIEGKTVMLVDDIVDEGKTMEFATRYLQDKYHPKKIITAALVLKPHSTFSPDDYMKSSTEWIVFPWEATKEQ